jgi:hypothetical protein
LPSPLTGRDHLLEDLSPLRRQGRGTHAAELVSRMAPRLDGASEEFLVVLGQKRLPPDALEVEAHQVRTIIAPMHRSSRIGREIFLYHE